MERFDKDKHHRRSTRLKRYDYSSKGAYFVTLVSHMRECLFGEVVADRVVLSALGEIVADEWKKSEEVRKNMKFDEFVIMPNHIHGIVHIIECRSDPEAQPVRRGDRPVALAGPPKRSLPSFISGFKSAVTKRINELRQMPGVPVWQRSYYEHIIRDDVSLNRIREYVINNPLQWDLDPENPKAKATNQGNSRE